MSGTPPLDGPPDAPYGEPPRAPQYPSAPYPPQQPPQVQYPPQQPFPAQAQCPPQQPFPAQAQYPPRQPFAQQPPPATYQPGWAPGFPVIPPMPRPGSMPIGPNDLGKTFGSTFGTLRSLWKQVLVAVAPAVILTAILVAVLGAGVARIAPTFEDRMEDVGSFDEFLSALPPHTVLLTLIGVVGYILIGLYSLAITVGTASAAGRSIAGDRMAVTFIIQSAVRGFPRVLAWVAICAVVLTVFAGLGLLAFMTTSEASTRAAFIAIVAIVAGIVLTAAQIVFALKLPFVVPAMMLEPRSADPTTGVVTAGGTRPLGLLHAARRSWKLTTGRAWRTLGMLLLLSLLVGIGPGVINQVLSVIVGLATNGVDTGAAYVVAYTIYFAIVVALYEIVAMVGTIGQTVLYTDARIRDEGIAQAVLDHAESGSPADPWVRWHERY